MVGERPKTKTERDEVRSNIKKALNSTQVSHEVLMELKTAPTIEEFQKKIENLPALLNKSAWVIESTKAQKLFEDTFQTMLASAPNSTSCEEYTKNLILLKPLADYEVLNDDNRRHLIRTQEYTFAAAIATAPNDEWLTYVKDSTTAENSLVPTLTTGQKGALKEDKKFQTALQEAIIVARGKSIDNTPMVENKLSIEKLVLIGEKLDGAMSAETKKRYLNAFTAPILSSIKQRSALEVDAIDPKLRDSPMHNNTVLEALNDLQYEMMEDKKPVEEKFHTLSECANNSCLSETNRQKFLCKTFGEILAEDAKLPITERLSNKQVMWMMNVITHPKGPEGKTTPLNPKLQDQMINDVVNHMRGGLKMEVVAAKGGKEVLEEMKENIESVKKEASEGQHQLQDTKLQNALKDKIEEKSTKLDALLKKDATLLNKLGNSIRSARAPKAEVKAAEVAIGAKNQGGQSI